MMGHDDFDLFKQSQNNNIHSTFAQIPELFRESRHHISRLRKTLISFLRDKKKCNSNKTKTVMETKIADGFIFVKNKAGSLKYPELCHSWVVFLSK